MRNCHIKAIPSMRSYSVAMQCIVECFRKGIFSSPSALQCQLDTVFSSLPGWIIPTVGHGDAGVELVSEFLPITVSSENGWYKHGNKGASETPRKDLYLRIFCPLPSPQKMLMLTKVNIIPPMV